MGLDLDLCNVTGSEVSVQMMFTTQKVGRKKETHIHFMLGFYVTYQPFYCSLALVMTFFYDHNILIQRVKEVIKAKFPLLKIFSKPI